MLKQQFNRPRNGRSKVGRLQPVHRLSGIRVHQPGMSWLQFYVDIANSWGGCCDLVLVGGRYHGVLVSVNNVRWCLAWAWAWAS